jgi:hypothetical protein
MHTRLNSRLPERLAARLRAREPRSNGHSDLMPLGDAEELLLAIDGALGDGSGRVLEAASLALFSHMLSRDAGVVIVGDLFATVARMRAPLERPFVGVAPLFELARTDTGLSLTVGVVGRPRSAKVLRGLASGLIRAAARYCREATASELKLHADTLGDRANVVARYRQSVAADPAEVAPPSHAPRRSRTTTQPRLSVEVERILSRPPSTEASPHSDHPGPISARSRQRSSVRPRRTDNQEEHEPKRSRR